MFENDIIIVGSGKTVLDHDCGNIIDSFGTVIRFNGYQLSDITNAGNKTDVIYTNSSPQAHDLIVNKKLLNENSYYIVTYFSSPTCKKRFGEITSTLKNNNIKFKTIHKKGVDIKINNYKVVSKKPMTLGLYCIIKNLSLNKPIYIHGFDYVSKNFDNAIHECGFHYYSSKKMIITNMI